MGMVSEARPQDKTILEGQRQRKDDDQNYRIVEFQSQEIPEIWVGISMDSRVAKLPKFSGSGNQLDSRILLSRICESESLSFGIPIIWNSVLEDLCYTLVVLLLWMIHKVKKKKNPITSLLQDQLVPNSSVTFGFQSKLIDADILFQAMKNNTKARVNMEQ